MAEKSGKTKTTRTEILRDGTRRLASKQAEACLVVIHGPQLGELVPLTEQSLVLGRSSDCEVQILGRGVSRTHCRVWGKEGAHFVEDLGSTNGLFVNERAVTVVRLQDGDFLAIGDTVLKYIGERSVEARYHAEVHEQVSRDDLTELYNRRHFQNILEAEVVRCMRYGRPVSLIFIDVDRFKAVNDTFGHLAGDSVLSQLAELLLSRVREADTLCRIGGEEFGILLPETALEGAIQVAESHRTLVEAHRFESPNDSPISLTVSQGVAEWGEEMVMPNDLVGLADRRLYAAKTSGRNRVEPHPS